MKELRHKPYKAYIHGSVSSRMSKVYAYSQEKMMQHVGAGLVAIQAATRMRPPDPESVTAAVVIHAAPGSEAAAKYLLSNLDSMQAQVMTRLH